MNQQWKPIASAPKNQLVMVYTPPQPSDWPDSVRIGFDYIDTEIADDYWYNHGEHYEHYCCVAKPENCTGPQERAPYTHWMPLPAAPGTPPASAQDDAKDDGLAEAQRLAQALFQRHFAQDDDYVSGRVKWEVLDDLPGVLSQISNMVSGLVQPAAPAAGDARDAARYRCIRNPPYSDRYGDLYAMTFQGDGDIPLKGEALDAATDRALAASQQQEG